MHVTDTQQRSLWEAFQGARWVGPHPRSSQSAAEARPAWPWWAATEIWGREGEVWGRTAAMEGGTGEDKNGGHWAEWSPHSSLRAAGGSKGEGVHGEL